MSLLDPLIKQHRWNMSFHKILSVFQGQIINELFFFPSHLFLKWGKTGQRLQFFCQSKSSSKCSCSTPHWSLRTGNRLEVLCSETEPFRVSPKSTNSHSFGNDSIRKKWTKQAKKRFVFIIAWHTVERWWRLRCRMCVDSVRLPWTCVFARPAACIRVHACLPTIWAHTLSCQGSAQLIFMHSVTSSLQTLLNILFPWAFHCCLVSEINMYEARRWEFLIDLCGPALLFNICLGLLVPAQWRWNNRDNLLR